MDQIPIRANDPEFSTVSDGEKFFLKVRRLAMIEAAFAEVRNSDLSTSDATEEYKILGDQCDCLIAEAERLVDRLPLSSRPRATQRIATPVLGDKARRLAVDVEVGALLMEELEKVGGLSELARDEALAEFPHDRTVGLANNDLGRTVSLRLIELAIEEAAQEADRTTEISKMSTLIRRAQFGRQTAQATEPLSLD